MAAFYLVLPSSSDSCSKLRLLLCQVLDRPRTTDSNKSITEFPCLVRYRFLYIFPYFCCLFGLQMPNTKIRPHPMLSPSGCHSVPRYLSPNLQSPLTLPCSLPTTTRRVRLWSGPPGTLISIPSVVISLQVLLPQVVVVLIPKATVPWIPSYVLEDYCPKTWISSSYFFS